MKKFKSRDPSDRLLIFVTLLLIASLTGILWFYGQRINTLWQQNGNSFDQSEARTATVDAKTAVLVQSAIKSLYRDQAVTDPLQNRVYIPEAKIYLPLNDLSRGLVYFYAAATKYNPEELQLSSTYITNRIPITFDDVPCLQRHVSVGFKDKIAFDGDENPVGSVKLDDGRALYIFEHDNNNCSGIGWSNGKPSAITALLKQARSY